MPQKACHKENPRTLLLGGPSKCPGKLATKRNLPRARCLEDLENAPESLPQREPKNPARTLLGGPSKCPGKLATKRTVPGPC